MMTDKLIPKYTWFKHSTMKMFLPGAGTVNGDTLCMDASDTKVVVAGFNSQKVWVFSVEEEDSVQLSMVPDFLVRMSLSPKTKSKQLVTKLTKV